MAADNRYRFKRNGRRHNHRCNIRRILGPNHPSGKRWNKPNSCDSIKPSRPLAIRGARFNLCQFRRGAECEPVARAAVARRGVRWRWLFDLDQTNYVERVLLISCNQTLCSGFDQIILGTVCNF